MALVSPGVEVSVIDESFYGSSGPGTVPLIVLATGTNKPTPDGAGIAPGTLPENAGKLYLMTSQREMSQTFGDPRFYSTGGTPIHGYELNEYGVHAAYQYLGISNRAYIVRGDVDTTQLEPTVFEPRSEAAHGQYWFDIAETSFGIFTNNGSAVPGLSWDSEVPTLIDVRTETENVVIGSVPYASNLADVLTVPGTYDIIINGVTINIIHTGVNLTLQDVTNAINAAAIQDIDAKIFRLSGLSYIALFNVAGNDIIIENGPAFNLTNLLGVNGVPQVSQPKRSIGQEGSVSVVVLNDDNLVFQKLKPLDSDGSPDSTAISMWFLTGTNNWKAATPTVIIGTTTPTLPVTLGDTYTVTDNSSATNTVDITFGTAWATIALIVTEFNNTIAFAAAGLQQDGVTPLAGGAVDLPIMAYVSGTAIKLVNYNGGDIGITESALNSSQGVLASLGLPSTVYGNELVYAPHTAIPQNGKPGDIWIKTTKPNLGADWRVKQYSRTTGQFRTKNALLYANDDEASTSLGINAASGTLYVEYNVYGTTTYPIGSHIIRKYLGAGVVDVTGTKIPGTGTIPGLLVGDTFVIVAAAPAGSGYISNSVVITLNASVSDLAGNVDLDGVATLINDASASIPGVTAVVDASGKLVISNTNQLSLEMTYIDPNTNTSIQAPGRDPLYYMGFQDGSFSRWELLTYEALIAAPSSPPIEGQLWYNTDFRVDIMVNDTTTGDTWIGYKNAYPATDAEGVLLGGTPPLTQRNGSPLVENDLWVDTTDLENYPRMYRWRVSLTQWEEIDNADQTTPFGVVFNDARSNSDGKTDGSELPADMLVSSFVDPDAPDPRTYPGGILLFNTRYSTYNVKQWEPNYFASYVGADLTSNPGFQYEIGGELYPTDTITDANQGRWVTASGNMVDGAPYMGRKAQRNMIVKSLGSVIIANQDIRSESLFFNLVAAPGYPEMLDELASLNTDKKEMAFIVGDTPARLAPDATSIQEWATNANNAPSTGDDGLTTSNTYAGLYYPWGLSTNIDGSVIFVPPSTIALKTIAYNDLVAFPWFAPAGLRRGLVTNASTVGYLNAGEYRPVLLNPGQRDVLQLNKINPISFVEGRGLAVFGQKTLHPTDSALDRINVARLVNYMRYNLDLLGKPFLFEPNDKITRDEVKTTFDRWMGNLISLRAIYDYAVVCDSTNNTPERIDRNELYIDIAVKPVKSVEFIYIPIRIRNTGDQL